MEIFWVVVGVILAVVILALISKQSAKNNKHKEDEQHRESMVFIDHLLKASRYQMTPHGGAVSAMSLLGGYTKEETFLYMALISLAQHIKDAGNDATELMSASVRGGSLAKDINSLYASGGIRAAIYQNEMNTLLHLINIDESQEGWVDIVLKGDPAASVDRVTLPIPN